MVEESGAGVSFVSALRTKFEQCDGTFSSVSIAIYVPKSAVGKSKSGQLIIPSQLALNFCNITHAGPVSEVTDCLVDVCELDLATNNISQWEEVFRIMTYLPKAALLNLSSNPLYLSRPIAVDDGTVLLCCNRIQKLVLNSAKIPWDVIGQLVSLMPQLRELHISLNDYCTVSLPKDLTATSLVSLFFNSNNVESWSEICKLGHAFPNLTSLIMTGNPLTSFKDAAVEADNSNVGGDDDGGNIQVSKVQDTAVASFCTLKCLNVGETQLGSWSELETLARFPSLADVRLHGITFFAAVEEKLRRQLMVGYLPNINRLNGSEVTAEERETANRAFIRYYMNSAHDKPPRYHELVGELGELDALADVSLQPASFVFVTVHFEETSSVRRFRLSATMLDVKRMLAKNLVHLPTFSFRLYHHDVGSPYGHELMKFPQRTLLSYHVKDGDEIFIVPSQRRQS